MNNKLVIIGIPLILISIGLSGCNEVHDSSNTNKSKFIGTWITEDIPFQYNITFKYNGKFIIPYPLLGSYGGTGEYEVKDGKLILNFDHYLNYYDLTSTMNYSFSDNNTKLILIFEQGHQLNFTNIKYLPETEFDDITYMSVSVSGTNGVITIKYGNGNINPPDVPCDGGFDIFVNGTKMGRGNWSLDGEWNVGESIILTANENDIPLATGTEYAVIVRVKDSIIYDSNIIISS